MKYYLNYMQQWRGKNTWWRNSQEMWWSVQRPVCAVLGDDEIEEIEVLIEYSYKPGGADTYDASRGGPGGWDPGDPAEAEVYGFAGTDGCVVDLSEDEEQAALDYVYDNPPDTQYNDCYDDHGEYA